MVKITVKSPLTQCTFESESNIDFDEIIAIIDALGNNCSNNTGLLVLRIQEFTKENPETIKLIINAITENGL